MITFFPTRDLYFNAKCLDTKRLISTIHESELIFSKLGKSNHPSVLMWENFSEYLKVYQYALYKEYEKRFDKKHKNYKSIVKFPEYMPKWTLNKKVTFSHMVRLLNKKFDHYINYFSVPACRYPEGYFWPICVGKKAVSDTENWNNFYNKYPTIFNMVTINKG